jgi:hypothetical protein
MEHSLLAKLYRNTTCWFRDSKAHHSSARNSAQIYCAERPVIERRGSISFRGSARTFGDMAVVLKNVLTHANVPWENTEKEMIHEMQEFIKFSEYDLVNDHCSRIWY